MSLRTAVAVCAIALGSSGADARTDVTVTIAGPVKILDGDTLEIGPVLIRLNGIDAPEAGQSCATPSGGTWPCGDRASARLADWIDGREITCVALDRDAYSRILATCHADGLDVGATLVAEGVAWAFREYSDVYADLENHARAQSLGIWVAESLTPSAYRAARWERAADASPRPGCPIKGNIARDGERIYHTPWSPAYAKTKINLEQGERWFCDEAEAVQAGWRAARWR